LWLNLTFNQYAIQLAHRLAAAVLWVALFGAALVMWRRRAPAWKVVGVVLVIVTGGQSPERIKVNEPLGSPIKFSLTSFGSSATWAYGLER
jgi:hypothetical protein